MNMIPPGARLLEQGIKRGAVEWGGRGIMNKCRRQIVERVVAVLRDLVLPVDRLDEDVDSWLDIVESEELWCSLEEEFGVRFPDGIRTNVGIAIDWLVARLEGAWLP